MDMSRTTFGGGFNRRMQHTKDCASSGSVADETATALAALEALRERIPVSAQDIRLGLANVELAARFQVLRGKPQIILDVAHNPHAARSLADGLSEMGYHENTFAVFAMLGDKDIGGVVDALRGRIDRWFVAAAVAERAAPASQVAEILAERGLGAVTRSFATVPAALEAARRAAGPNDRIVVFGSFHTVAEALRPAR